MKPQFEAHFENVAVVGPATGLARFVLSSQVSLASGIPLEGDESSTFATSSGNPAEFQHISSIEAGCVEVRPPSLFTEGFPDFGGSSVKVPTILSKSPCCIQATCRFKWPSGQVI